MTYVSSPSRLHWPSHDHARVPVGPEVRGHGTLAVPEVGVLGDCLRVAEGPQRRRLQAWGRPVEEARCLRRAAALCPSLCSGFTRCTGFRHPGWLLRPRQQRRARCTTDWRCGVVELSLSIRGRHRRQFWSPIFPNRLPSSHGGRGAPELADWNPRLERKLLRRHDDGMMR